MICTGYNPHIISLIMAQQVLWKCVLDDGTSVYSDFDYPELKDPWTRLKHYCHNNRRNINEVYAIVPGQPEQLIFKDENGLDGLFLSRGHSENINFNDHTIHSFVVFGLVGNDNKIYVRRFYWPECQLGTHEEIREITPENQSLIYYKKDICRCRS